MLQAAGRRALVLSGVAAALLAAGCASGPKPTFPVPRALEISVQAAPGLNPDVRDRPTPVVLRIYELRSPVAFEAADFFTLFDKDQAALGNDIVGKEELQLRPGESAKLVRELKPETRTVGVFAAFRDLERSRWRAVVALPDPPPPAPAPPPKPLGVPLKVTLGARDVQIAR
ncbi:MAG: type VI secretion system lipoprotein TssJ [Burkholderiaceae bacterium]